MQQHAINWFEIPVTVFERARIFYNAIFDFEMPVMDMDGIRMGFFQSDQQNGGVGGAIVHAPGQESSGQGARVYLNGDPDLNTVLNRIEAAGGQVVDRKTPIPPDFGYFATFIDTEGNQIGLHSMS
jgi:predicted enzyme related to lactoylglutathione lyase